jgi:hypothetical protein
MFEPAIRHSVFAVCTVKNFKHMLGMHLKGFSPENTKSDGQTLQKQIFLFQFRSEVA